MSVQQTTELVSIFKKYLFSLISSVFLSPLHKIQTLKGAFLDYSIIDYYYTRSIIDYYSSVHSKYFLFIHKKYETTIR